MLQHIRRIRSWLQNLGRPSPVSAATQGAPNDAVLVTALPADSGAPDDQFPPRKT